VEGYRFRSFGRFLGEGRIVTPGRFSGASPDNAVDDPRHLTRPRDFGGDDVAPGNRHGRGKRGDKDECAGH